MMKIVLSGGHLTPAYSFSEVASKKGDQLLLIGSAGKDSTEARELAKLGAAYGKIKPVKFDRYHVTSSLIALPALLVPTIEAYTYLRTFKPQVAVTFGGFNAVPVAIAAKLLGVPFIVHEQTRTTGLANRLLSKFAARCALSYPESLPFFPAIITKTVGNPLRSEFWHPPLKNPLALPTRKPILFITGGNQGSQSILKVIIEVLPRLIPKYQIVIQYGLNQSLMNKTIPEEVVAQPWFDSQTTSYLVHHARMVISRAGANTTAEIMVAGTPAIFIPLPKSSQDEQIKNAGLIVRLGGGLRINQPDLSPSTILEAIGNIEHDYDIYQQNAKKLKALQHPHAAQSLYQLAQEIVNG